jgi:hypothetical protein
VTELINIAEADAQPSHFQLACLNARVGDKGTAHEYLWKAYQRRSFLIAFVEVEPQLDPLRDDPRFTDLV